MKLVMQKHVKKTHAWFKKTIFLSSVSHLFILLGKSPHFSRSRQDPGPAAPATESLAFALAENCGACKYNGNFRSLQVLKHHQFIKHTLFWGLILLTRHIS
jgi:hypothetical protein